MGNCCTAECFSASVQATNELLDALNHQINNFADTANKLKVKRDFNPQVSTRKVAKHLKARGFTYKAKTQNGETTHVIKRIQP